MRRDWSGFLPIFLLSKSAIKKVTLLWLREGWGELSVRNLFEFIDKRRCVPLHRFIYALGIPQIGEATAKRLAEAYLSFD